MKDQLISFNVAKLAKEKGLDVSSNYFREHEYGDADFDDDFCNWNQYDGYVTIITQSLLQKWLREEHSIYIDIKTDTTPNEILGFEVRLKSYKFAPHYIDFFNSYEEAIETGLMSALEIIQ